MARPHAEFDRSSVKKLASIGCTVDEIATFCGVSKDTIERNAMVELDEGRAEGRISLRRKQWQKAMSGQGDRTMLIWLGKQLLGQRDRLEHLGDQSPLESALRARAEARRAASTSGAS